MTIAELMAGIRNLDLVLPEFQREYVWSREQAKRLMVSLLRDILTGSLLFWKTANPPDIKNNAVSRERIGTTSVILDGQQRLTTLYMLICDAIPPYYTPANIKDDPRNLYFDLDTGDFSTVNSSACSTIQRGFQWRRFLSKSMNVFALAEEKSDDKAEQFELSQRYNANSDPVLNIREKPYPEQVVPQNADIDDAIDVFDRVNSLGTKLSDAELALAHITGKWPQARQAMKDKGAELSNRRYGFDLTFFVRSLTGVVRGRALFETVHDAPREELIDGWNRLVKILDYLVSVLPQWAHIHSTDDVNTTNVLVPAVVYLNRHGGQFRDERSLKQFVRWIYAASSWARYTSQTDQRLDHDVSIFCRMTTHGGN